MVSNDFIFYLLSTARTSHGTNNLEMKEPNILSIMVWSATSHRMLHWWRGDFLTIVCLATRITSRSLQRITHTMLTPPGIFVYFELSQLCACDPTPKVKFPDKWLASLAATLLRLSFLSRGSGCTGIKCKVEKLLARANKLPLEILEWLFKTQWTTLKNT